MPVGHSPISGKTRSKTLHNVAIDTNLSFAANTSCANVANKDKANFSVSPLSWSAECTTPTMIDHILLTLSSTTATTTSTYSTASSSSTTTIISSSAVKTSSSIFNQPPKLSSKISSNVLS